MKKNHGSANKQKIKCKQCGRCCIVWNPVKQQYEDCKYLVKYINMYPFGEELTRCTIYKHRIGAILGDGQVCVSRIDNQWNYPECPYNKEGQPLHPFYR